MKVIIQPELDQKAEFKAIAEATTAILENAIGEPASRVTADWSFRLDDHGRPLICLTLSDWTGQVAADFAPDELQPPERSRRRFIRLWGDLLEDASRRQIQALEAAVVDGGDS